MSADIRPGVACLSGRRVVDVLDALDVYTVLLDDPTPLELACRVDVPLDIDLSDWAVVESAVSRIHSHCGRSKGCSACTTRMCRWPPTWPPGSGYAGSTSRPPWPATTRRAFG